MNDEIWKPIDFMNGVYHISNYGRVKSFVKNKEGHIMSYHLQKGYVYYRIGGRTSSKLIRAHRIVAEYFIGKSDKEVNHIDGNKINNYVGNLEYCTRKENMEHANKTGLLRPMYGDRNPATKLSIEKVIDIKIMLKEGHTHKEIGNKFNVHPSTIGRIATKENWKYVII